MRLIGRQGAQRETLDRLQNRRLVTVIGPAGIGKTVLARAVADQVDDDGELAVRHVDLTRVDTEAAVGGAFAAQLGGSSADALLATVAAEPVLLVVDNCEHVTDAAAATIAELLAAAPDARVLATSRSPLGLVEESLVVLGPLGLPAPGEDGGRAAAVQLFLERAVDAGATVAPREVATVAELCRRLDGVPLAIELAAAQSRVLPPAELLERLSQGIAVLARHRFHGPHRHRSLEDTIEWSYRLLPPAAASTFERLGLFAGPFTPELAEAVAGDAGLDPDEAREALRVLVDSSLVVAEPGADRARLRLLQTVRAFARDQLDAGGAGAEARQALAGHLVEAVLEVATTFAGGQWDPAAIDQLTSLYDTIETTVRWWLDGDGDGRGPLILCAALLPVVANVHTEDIAALCEAVLARWPDPTVPGAADAVATAATARCLVGDPAGALELAEAMLAHADGSALAPATLRRAMAYAADALGDTRRALALFDETAAIARERDLVGFALEAKVNGARLQAVDPDHGLDEALEAVAAARREAVDRGSAVNELLARTVEANLVLRTDLARGAELAQDLLGEAHRVGYPDITRYALRPAAWAAIRTGDHQGAASILSELLDIVLARGAVADVQQALYATAELLHDAGDPDWEPLAATAAALPPVGLTREAADPPPELPAPSAPPLSQREAFTLAREALRRLRDEAAEPEETPPSTTASASITDRGGLWVIEFGGRTVHAKPSKGLRDIARLLAAPGREVHCLDLMDAAVEQPAAGEAIDETARRQYEVRIRDLQAEVDGAEADNDVARAEKAQVELDAIVDHLTSALGLGGRHRRAGGSTERARSAVTQRIRAAINRLVDDHPPLARHLEVSVTTGTWCAYRPEHPVQWAVPPSAVIE